MIASPILGAAMSGRLPQLANGRMHWAARAKLVKEIKAEAWGRMVSARNEVGLPKATEPRMLRITAYVCGRLYDMDNLVANIKPLVDAAVLAGWLADDSPEWMTLRARQVRVKTRAEQRVEVSVEAR